MSLLLYIRGIICAPCPPQTRRKRNRVQFQQERSHWDKLLVGRGATHDDGSPRRAAGFEEQIRKPSARNDINTADSASGQWDGLGDLITSLPAPF